MSFFFGFVMGSLVGAGVGMWASRKHAKDPLYFKTRFARLFDRKVTNDERK